MSDNWNFDDLVEDVLVKTSEMNACCGSDLSFPDTSKVENPENSKNQVTEEFLQNFEEYLKNYDIGYVNGIEDLYLHDYNFDFKSAIIISHEMPQEILDAGAGVEAQDLNNELYENFGHITYSISDYLRKNGYETYVAHPREEKINFSKLAERANMGIIGKSGLFISPKFGPKQKIAAILVNIENLPIINVNEHAWIRKYCESCNSCIRKCPEKALNNFDEKVQFDENLCIGCSQGCTECIKACPFYKRGYEKVYAIFKKLEEKRKK